MWPVRVGGGECGRVNDDNQVLDVFVSPRAQAQMGSAASHSRALPPNQTPTKRLLQLMRAVQLSLQRSVPYRVVQEVIEPVVTVDDVREVIPVQQ